MFGTSEYHNLPDDTKNSVLENAKCQTLLEFKLQKVRL